MTDPTTPSTEHHRVAVWNPASGGAPSEVELREALGDDVELVSTTADDPGAGQAERAVAAGASTVIAVGGDGTVRAVLDALAGTATSLALVPTGTGNLLAANLGIPTGLDAAANGLGGTRSVDLGRVNGEAFAVMAGCGFDARMIRDANDGLKARIGTAAYVLSGLRRLHTELVGTTVEVDGATWFDDRTSMVLVGNFPTISGGIDLFPEAAPDDGRLDVIVLAANTIRSWAKVAWCVLRGRDLPPELGRRTQGTRITVDLARPRPYELDGEDRPATNHLEFTLDAAAIVVHEQGA